MSSKYFFLQNRNVFGKTKLIVFGLSATFRANITCSVFIESFTRDYFLQVNMQYILPADIKMSLV